MLTLVALERFGVLQVEHLYGWHEAGIWHCVSRHDLRTK